MALHDKRDEFDGHYYELTLPDFHAIEMVEQTTRALRISNAGSTKPFTAEVWTPPPPDYSE